jgi:hypothetical protein
VARNAILLAIPPQRLDICLAAAVRHICSAVIGHQVKEKIP